MPDPETNRISNAPPAVRLAGGRVVYGGDVLFDGLEVDLPAGQWTCVLGPSGVGKSTLLRLLVGLDAGQDAVADVAASDGAPLAGRIGYMAQTDLLHPWLTVIENATLGARLRGERRDLEGARRLLAAVGLAEAEKFRPDALSGGMRQRAALARTLMEDRPVVLMDEPFSALDAISRLRLQDLAARLLAGRTVLLVTHDPLEALRLGHHVHVLSGRPARLGEAMRPPGPPPRPVDDPALLEMQAELLGRLAGAAA